MRPEDPVRRALEWLTGPGGGAATGGVSAGGAAHAPAWTRAAPEDAGAHALTVVAALRGLGADQQACVLATLACAATLPDAAWWHDGLDAGFVAELPVLVAQTQRVLELSGADFTVEAGDSKAVARALRAERIRRMLLALAADVRVVLVKLCSALHTLQLGAARARHGDGPFDAVSLQRLAGDARTLLAPLAARIGLHALKNGLEDGAFEVLDPDGWAHLDRELARSRAHRAGLLDAARQRLADRLAAAGLDAQVGGRSKHRYGIHRKMQRKGPRLSAIHDLLAMRVIVDTVRDCYRVLDEVQQLWTPIPSEFADYIARPKPNGYRSLHTIVADAAGTVFEVQIRTHDMHRFAESGVAAHWRYKDPAAARAAGRGGRAGDAAGAGAGRAGGAVGAGGADGAGGAGAGGAGGAGAPVPAGDRLDWLRGLIDWQADVGAGLVGGGGSTVDARRVYVVTPQGRIVELEQGATPVDFAYRVHTDLGHRCRGARVDGRLVALDTPLRNGQVVEIVTARDGAGGAAGAAGPSRDWLNPSLGFVRSDRTRTKIRQWFVRAQRAAELARGRERVERAMAREGRSALSLQAIAAAGGLPDADALFLAAAREQIGPRMLEALVRAAQPARGDVAAPGDRPERHAPGVQHGHGQRPPVLVLGTDFLLTHMARCCRPVPGDAIAGFITQGRGVSVHRERCPAFHALRERAPERIVEARWGEAPEAPRFDAEIEIQASERGALLRDLADVLARDRLTRASARSMPADRGVRLRYVVAVTGTEALRTLLAQLGAVPGVHRAVRVDADGSVPAG